MTAGALITLEGIEGVGKSTNVEFVASRLRAAGKDVVVTREPGGTPLGERVRSWVLDEDHGGPLSAEVEALLMFAARAQHLDRVIRPALQSGRWVVCDRFTDATFAYQGAARGADRRLLESLKTYVQRDVEPKLTLHLDAPLDVGRERIRARRPDHFEREDRVFFECVRAAYLTLAAEEPARIKVIDATQPLAAVQSAIGAHLTSVLAAANAS
jgi:dTMP kinase